MLPYFINPYCYLFTLFDEKHGYSYNPGNIRRSKEFIVMQRQGDELLTTKQVAEEMKVNERRVLNWIKKGELVAIDLGRDYRIYRSDLNAFIEKRRTKQQ